MNKIKLFAASAMLATLTITTFTYADECSDLNGNADGEYTGIVNYFTGTLGVTVDIENISSKGPKTCQVSGTISWENTTEPLSEFSFYNTKTKMLSLSAQSNSSFLSLNGTFSTDNNNIVGMVINDGNFDGKIIESGTLNKANN